MVLLVSAFRIKEPDYYSHSFFKFFLVFQDSLECDEIFVQFVQLNKYLGNAPKLVQRVPPFIFLIFKGNIQNRTKLKGPPFHVFSAQCNFFRIFLSPKCPPFDFIEVPLVISGAKRYIRIFDIISELYRVLLSRRRRFENRSPTHTLKTSLFDP